MDKSPGLLAQALMLAATLACVYGSAHILLSLEKSHAPQAPAVTGKGSAPSSPSKPAAFFIQETP